jgi:hypothetical protein
MTRIIFAIGLATAALSAAPAVAATAQQKLETCTFGADDQKLTGAARKKFMSNCMANRNSPRGKPVPAPKPQ